MRLQPGLRHPLLSAYQFVVELPVVSIPKRNRTESSGGRAVGKCDSPSDKPSISDGYSQAQWEILHGTEGADDCLPSQEGRALQATGSSSGPSSGSPLGSPLGLSAKLPVFAYAAKERAYLWRRRCATLAIGALALGMAYGVVFGHNGLTSFAHKRAQARSLQREMQQLQRENDSLHAHVDRLQNDPDAIEHEAREELHYTRAGEVIYTLPDGAGKAKPQ